jgi:hypothetical protein
MEASRRWPRGDSCVREVTLAITGVLFCLFTSASYATLPPAPTNCAIDAAANDAPDQDDLTKECTGGSSGGFDFLVKWNWDKVDFSGGNSGDGCALFDRNGDGLADFAVCVSIETINNVTQEVAGYPQVYSCGNTPGVGTKADRCAMPTLLCSTPGSGSISTCQSACEATITNDDPFPAGEASTQDTQALCGIKVSDFSTTGTPILVNVCSFPSQSPNSNPFDCILKQACTLDSDCDDGDPCTADTCNSTSNVCQHTPVTNGTACDDGNACTPVDTCQAGFCTGSNPVTCAAPDQCHDAGVCDPSTGICSNPPKDDGTGCDDGEACTYNDTCSSGVCAGTPITCTSDTCTTQTCNGTSSCTVTPNTGDPCDDANACTFNDICSSSGVCGGTPITCTSDTCTTQTCNGTSSCTVTPNTGDPCDDGNACTFNDVCSSGGVCGGTTITCTNDQCNTRTCNGTSSCTVTPKADGTSCSDDGFACTIDGCKAGVCAHTPNNAACADTDICTVDRCITIDPNHDQFGCVHVFTPANADECSTKVCRTAGFWGTHGGTEKKTINTTLAVLKSVGCLDVCGQRISNTDTNNDDSAIEALCVSVQGTQQVQLARQLTATALNCIVSNGTTDCSNINIGEVSLHDVFAACNNACIGGTTTKVLIGTATVDCIQILDCFSNGGIYNLSNGFCTIGTCTGSGIECSPTTNCGTGSQCMRTPGNCEDAPLTGGCNGITTFPTGNASSSTACNTATGTGCTIVGGPPICPSKKGTGEACCANSQFPESSEACPAGSECPTQ